MSADDHWNPRRIACLLALLLVPLILFAPLSTVSAQADATPAASPAATFGTVPMDADSSTSPEQQLADKFVPIIALKTQDVACDTSGEPYAPVAVDVVLGDPTVLLKRNTGSSSATDEVVKEAPVARDLYAKGSDYYIDLPGNPRKAGCTYEQWFKERNAGYPPAVYAHIVSNGTNRLALQYWFYYVYNDFNNKHESDWEMMQLLFEVGTVEDALNAEPVQVALAQHGGGETADWGDSKLQRDGQHVIVYSAVGSHASQYENAVYLGWGENGTGFGCDTTTGPSTLVNPTAILLPSSEPDPAGQFAWLNFEGRWGERKQGEFNGPTGPATKTQWASPFLWQSGLRDSSIEVPLASTFGPAPTEVFCSLSSAGSSLFTRIGENTPLLLGTAVGIIAGVTALLRYSWGVIGKAIRIYRLRWGTFALIGLVLIPVGIVFNGFQYLVAVLPPGKQILALMGQSPGAYYAQAMLVGILQHMVGLIIVGPAVIQTYKEMETNEHLSPVDAYKAVLRNIRPIAVPFLKAAVILILLCVTLIGIPVAVWLLVRWLFIPQAVMLDRQLGDDAMKASKETVQHHWLPTAAKALVLTIVGSAPGAIIGLILLIFGSTTVQFTNVAASLIFAVFLPFSLLGLTILYRMNQGRKITPLDYTGPAVARTTTTESTATA